MSIDILKEDIKNNKIRSLYLFHGPEEYLKKHYLGSIEKKVLREDMIALNRIVLDGKFDIGKVIEASETMPVFSDMKVVIVKNTGIFKPKKKSEGVTETKNKGQEDSLLRYLQNAPKHTCLIFYESEIDKRIKIVDTIKKNGLIVEFVFQKPNELVKWVTKILKSNKKEIDNKAASLLVDNSEAGMSEILNEVNKLIAFLGERCEVRTDDIEKVCTKSVKSRIFDLTDAIAENNGAKAFKILNDMVILKEPLPKILFMITRQFRQILEMKLLGDKGMELNELASRIGVSPYAAGKIARQANRFTVDKLKKAVKESLLMDIAIKTGKINDRIATELLIAKFSE